MSVIDFNEKRAEREKQEKLDNLKEDYFFSLDPLFIFVEEYIEAEAFDLAATVILGAETVIMMGSPEEEQLKFYADWPMEFVTTLSAIAMDMHREQLHSTDEYFTECIGSKAFDLSDK